LGFFESEESLVAYSHNNYACFSPTFDNFQPEQCYFAVYLCPFLILYFYALLSGEHEIK